MIWLVGLGSLVVFLLLWQIAEAVKDALDDREWPDDEAD